MVKKKKKEKKGIEKFGFSKRDINIAKKKTEVALRNAKERLTRAEKEIKRYIKKNPKKATLIAAGIGAAIGAAIGKSLKKSKN